jgi:NhaA family Na+:H+ antiporter
VLGVPGSLVGETDRRPRSQMSIPQLDRRTLPPFVQRFLATEAAGGVVLVVAAVAALVWANSPWRDTYTTLWHSPVSLRIGTFGFSGDVHDLVNDALMAIFFLVVGLEIKRELVTGDLRDPRVAALPAFAALGGMIVPALVYVAFTAGGRGSGGWGIPMATDIAFAVGVLALLGPRVPATLKLFLLSLAIVDDVGAILVIALFYTAEVDVAALAIAASAVVAAVLMRALRVHWLPVYVALGVLCWLATYQSGIHATIAGVVFGLLAPARPMAPAELARDWSLDLSDEPTADELRTLATIATESVSPAERIEHLLHPVTSFVIVPVFALANAGVEIRAGVFDASGTVAVALGVAVGLVVGKLVGITAATWLAVRAGIASLPEGATWSSMAGVAALAGIGFTVSLFVTGLAFDDAALADAAKLAILAASSVAAVVGATVLLREGQRNRRQPSSRSTAGSASFSTQ